MRFVDSYKFKDFSLDQLRSLFNWNVSNIRKSLISGTWVRFRKKLISLFMNFHEIERFRQTIEPFQKVEKRKFFELSRITAPPEKIDGKTLQKKKHFRNELVCYTML